MAMAMEPIVDSIHGDPNLFAMGHTEDGLCLNANLCDQERKWCYDEHWVFTPLE
jgi:hypothetical protein